MVAGLYSRPQPSVCDGCGYTASTLVRHGNYWYCYICINRHKKRNPKLIHKRRPMGNNHGRNLGRIEMVRMLGNYWAAGLGSLRFAARLALALILGGLFWLLLLGLSAFDWVME